jgi:iron complex outermembrane receptor protein
MFVSNFKAPFTPSLGLSYFIRTSDESFLKITSNLAKSYRIPTFNDRFWGDQGNPDLKPEKGNNFELGLHWGIDKNKLRSNLKINTFYMDIDELIEWRNLSGEWRARNVSKVETKGIELHGDAFFPFGKFEADVFLNYTWNPSVIANDIGDDMVVGRQLIYVPEHVGNIGFGLGHKKWSINIDGNYTGFRYIDYVEINGNYETVPGYFLANCALHYKLHMQKHKFNLTLSANNILDANYQNQYLYAMPGVSFRFIIKYDINILNN